jgi:glycosidase
MLQRAKVAIVRFGRDNARTPMHWIGAKPNAGSTTGEPWMPMMQNYVQVNVEEEQESEEGVLRMWREMIKLRREHQDVFLYGRFESF